MVSAVSRSEVARWRSSSSSCWVETSWAILSADAVISDSNRLFTSPRTFNENTFVLISLCATLTTFLACSNSNRRFFSDCCVVLSLFHNSVTELDCISDSSLNREISAVVHSNWSLASAFAWRSSVIICWDSISCSASRVSFSHISDCFSMDNSSTSFCKLALLLVMRMSSTFWYINSVFESLFSASRYAISFKQASWTATSVDASDFNVPTWLCRLLFSAIRDVVWRVSCATASLNEESSAANWPAISADFKWNSFARSANNAEFSSLILTMRSSRDLVSRLFLASCSPYSSSIRSSSSCNSILSIFDLLILDSSLTTKHCSLSFVCFNATVCLLRSDSLDDKTFFASLSCLLDLSDPAWSSSTRAWVIRSCCSRNMSCLSFSCKSTRDLRASDFSTSKSIIEWRLPVAMTFCLRVSRGFLTFSLWMLLPLSVPRGVNCESNPICAIPLGDIFKSIPTIAAPPNKAPRWRRLLCFVSKANGN